MMNNDMLVKKEINITFEGVCHVFFGYSHIVYDIDNPLHRSIATLEKFPFIQKYCSSRFFILQLGVKKTHKLITCAHIHFSMFLLFFLKRKS